MTSSTNSTPDIVSTQGDLLESSADAIVNTVNTVGIMGKGIALQFKRRYPANFASYKKACDAGEVRLGHMFVYELGQLDGPKWIINFPTKGHWRANSNLADIRSGLLDLVRVIRELSIESIAIPPLGAGNGGLKWMDVRPLIVDAFNELPHVRVELYEPNSGHHAIDPHPVAMTRSRAVLVTLVRNYLERRRAIEPWESASGASHLEIQKLMYFADKVDPSLHLKFAEGKYGPYSETVRAMIAEMEGWYLVGHGDGTDKVLDLKPIALTVRAVADADAFIKSVGAEGAGKEIISPVLAQIDGFESPYTLELLASVDWAKNRIGESKIDPVYEYVHNWTDRKHRLFTRDHVAIALNRLAS